MKQKGSERKITSKINFILDILPRVSSVVIIM